MPVDLLRELINLDHQLFICLNGMHNPYFDSVMHSISKVGVWIPLYISVAWLMVYKYGRKGWLLILVLILGVVLTDQISVLVKNYFERPRPSHHPALTEIIHLYKGHKGSKFGFVSSHATNTMGFALLTSLLVRNRFYTLCIFLWSTITCYSRIYLGMHFPADVVGATLLGLAIAWGLYAVTMRFLPAVKQPATRDGSRVPVSVLALSMLAIVIYGFVH